MILIACIFSIFSKTPDYVKAADQTMQAFNAKYCEEYAIKPINNSGLFNGKVDALFLDYEVNEAITEEKAKDLLTHLQEKFLDFVNHDEKISPYLVVYPLTDKHLSISVHAIKDTVLLGNLEGAEITENRISYFYKKSE